MKDTRAVFDLMSCSWSDGRHEPLRDYFDKVRGYKAQWPKPRKDRPPESVFPFGTGQATGRTTFDALPPVSARNGVAGDAFVRVPVHDLSADRPGLPVSSKSATARAAAYGTLDSPAGTGP